MRFHAQVTDRPSPDAPSLTQAMIVKMVHCLSRFFLSPKSGSFTIFRGFLSPFCEGENNSGNQAGAQKAIGKPCTAELCDGALVVVKARQAESTFSAAGGCCACSLRYADIGRGWTRCPRPNCGVY